MPAQSDQTSPPHDCAAPCRPPPAIDGGETDAAGAPMPNRPICCGGPWSVNQRLPSAPGVTSIGLLPAFRPALLSTIVPAGVIRPIARVVPWSVNQRFPSGPGAIAAGLLPVFRPAEYSVIAPVVVARPIA